MIFLCCVPVGADDGRNFIADGKSSFDETAAVNDAIGDFGRDIDDKFAFFGFDGSAVADLAAHLGVETGLVEDDAGFFARLEFAFGFENALVDKADDCRVTRGRSCICAGLRLRAVPYRASVTKSCAPFCAALARLRCCSIRALKPAVSTFRPRSCAISWVRSTGKP